MKKFSVVIPCVVYVTTEVEAEDLESAKLIACEEVGLVNYSGNGGFNKLIGSYNTDDTIEEGYIIPEGVKAEEKEGE